MSRLTPEQCDYLAPIVAQVAIGLKRRFHMLDRGDLEQECWVWVVSHPKQVRELEQMEDQKEAAKLAHWRIARAVRAKAEKEKAAMLGYEPDDLHFYSKKEMLKILKVVFDEDSWLSPPQGAPGAPPSGQDPAVGGNWVAILSDVSRAIDELPEEDREILLLRCKVGLTLHQLGDHFGVSHVTADRRVERALNKLHEQLGGERPGWDEPEPEYTGQRKHMTNQQAMATIRSYT